MRPNAFENKNNSSKMLTRSITVCYFTLRNLLSCCVFQIHTSANVLDVFYLFISTDVER